VLLEGPTADPNVAGRMAAWGDAMSFFAQHPLGTWGEPQALLQHFTDSQYVDALLQGSLPFAMAFLLALFGGIRPDRPPTGVSSFLTLSTVSIAVNSVSAHVLAYSSIGMYWLVLGYSSTARGAQRSVALARRPQILAVDYRKNRTGNMPLGRAVRTCS